MGRPLQNDLTGQRYDRLLVLFRSDRRDRVYWVCLCDCGRSCEVQSLDLIFGKQRSCGCYRRDRQREIMTVRNRKRP